MHYDPERQELLIVFRGNRETYRYFDVPIQEWEEFLEAGPKGTYLNRVFKAKEHPYEKTEETVRFTGQRQRELRLEWGQPEMRRKPVKAARALEQRTRIKA